MRPTTWLTFLLCGVSAAVAALVITQTLGLGPVASGAGRSAGRYPALPPDASAVALGTPAPAPAGEGGFSVLRTQVSGEPVGWDPCRPLHYVVNPAGAPAGADYLLIGAFTEIQRLTGQVVVAEGLTDEQPSDERALIQPDRYGDRWAPVLVAWSTPAESPMLVGPVAGYAGAAAVDGAQPGTERYVTGQVVLDAPQLAELAAGPAGLARARGVLLHELGHLMGLGHVEDPHQLMYHSTTMLGVEFADGDRRGLAAVSGRPCWTDW